MENQIPSYKNIVKLSYNKIYDKVYKSTRYIACTKPLKSWEHPGAGRWWWKQNSDKECGLHYIQVK